MDIARIASPVVGLLTTMSAGIAVDGVVKLVTPLGIKPGPSFVLKLGGMLLSGFVSGIVGDIATKNYDAIVEVLSPTSVPVEAVEAPSEEEPSDS